MTIKATTANTHTHTNILMWVLIVARGKLISRNEKKERKEKSSLAKFMWGRVPFLKASRHYNETANDKWQNSE